MSGASVSAPVAVARAILEHARRDRPAECCGFLLGRGAAIRYVLPMRNVAGARTRYRIADKDHIQIRRVLRGVVPPLEIVGVYHSHPAGDAVPSPTDVAEAMYPEWVHVIAGLGARRATLRAYRLRNGHAQEVRIRWRQER